MKRRCPPSSTSLILDSERGGEGRGEERSQGTQDVRTRPHKGVGVRGGGGGMKRRRTSSSRRRKEGRKGAREGGRNTNRKEQEGTGGTGGTGGLPHCALTTQHHTTKHGTTQRTGFLTGVFLQACVCISKCGWGVGEGFEAQIKAGMHE